MSRYIIERFVNAECGGQAVRRWDGKKWAKIDPDVLVKSWKSEAAAKRAAFKINHLYGPLHIVKV